LRAAAAPPLALDCDREFWKRRKCTRRFGGRRDRRVLEGMRGCSAHAPYIARLENKSRTLGCRPQPDTDFFCWPRESRVPQKAAAGGLI
jgi:hypothetical protein